MTQTDRQLFALLGRALFGGGPPLPDDTDYPALFRESAEQAVHLLAYNCLTARERSAMPPDTAREWSQLALATMWKNEQLLHEQQAVLEALEGIPCVILKGSSSAMYYPQPELRCAGDVDLLLAPADVPRAEALLTARGYCPPEEPHEFHRSLCRGQFVVELHFQVPGMPSGAAGTPIRAFFQDAVGRSTVQNGLPVLTPERQAVVLLLHKLEHLTSSGLGLRQLCDWAVFVHRAITPALWETLEETLRRFGLLYFARVITRICVEFLGLPRTDAPWCMTADSALCRELLEDILRTGNFGCKENRYGQRLFTSAQTQGRLTSLLRTGLETCRTHWPACKEHPILLPAAPAVLLLRYRRQRKEGKRPPFHPLRGFRSAGARQKLYRSLRPFLQEQEGK